MNQFRPDQICSEQISAEVQIRSGSFSPGQTGALQSNSVVMEWGLKLVSCVVRILKKKAINQLNKTPGVKTGCLKKTKQKQNDASAPRCNLSSCNRWLIFFCILWEKPHKHPAPNYCLKR